MKLGYTIIYVPDVEASLAFFETAFGMKRQLLVPTGDYGELATGETTLSFAHHSLGESHFSQGYIKASDSALPLGMEIALVTNDVAAAHTKAIASGASEVCAPEKKPWGQVISYIRSPDGCLIELCTPIQ